MNRPGKRRNRWLIPCGLTLGVFCGGSVSFGLELMMDQQVFGGRWGGPWVPPVQHVPTEQTQDGFVVSASGTAIEDTPAGQALRLIEEGQWVKAIQAIESLSDTDSNLVVDENGVLRPLSAMKSALIASMPEEGRRTFCQLNDPAANTKLAEALKTTDFEQRAIAFKAIVDSYALCDAAARAAEQLGDIRFEQGRFNEAAAYYHFAAKHPATTADDPTMMARRLTALARAEQWKGFDELAEYARFRHPDTTINVGGQDTPIQSFITDLVASRENEPIERGDSKPLRLNMPKDMDLEYDHDLIAEDHLRLLRQVAQNQNMSSIIDRTIAPHIATDGKRLFTLSLGSVARLDPQTGTELWRTGDPNETVQKLQQRMYHLHSGFHESLLVHGDTLLASLPGKGNQINTYLTAMNAESGEVKWNLYDTLRNNNEGVVGEPLVIDDLIYFVTYRSSMELTLRAVKLSDGSEVNQLALGKASKGPNLNAPAELSPRLAMGQGYLMVQTNNGALIAVDVNNMSIAWAYSQKVRQSGMNMMRRHGHFVSNAISRHTGDVIARDGLVIAKDTRTNQVVAFREYDAAMVWRADSDADSTIVHLDNEHIYVQGSELVALNRRTGERVWWTEHAGKTAGAPVFTDDACLIQGDLRLCRVDLRTGKLTHYREDIAEAAELRVIGNRLVSLGGQRMTAVAIP
ncbi:MAG: PQQ-binding-like beta-propeller repeat protein [Phycisphaeraceae bacterium]